jgi:hypothetical protein
MDKSFRLIGAPGTDIPGIDAQIEPVGTQGIERMSQAKLLGHSAAPSVPIGVLPDEDAPCGAAAEELEVEQEFAWICRGGSRSPPGFLRGH